MPSDATATAGRRRPGYRLVPLGVLAAVATSASIAVHSASGVGAPLSFTPWLLLILVAHHVFITEVRLATRRKTAVGRWMGLAYFGVFLAVLIGAYAAILARIGLHDGGTCDCQTHDLTTAVFFSVVTWTTVGYGDVTATQPAARFFAALEALNGYLVLALFIAAVVPVFQGLLQREDSEDRDR